jgi:hypothetical protein
MKIVTTKEQLPEGLFGQVLLWIFEILPYLDRQGIFPTWEIRSVLYGTPDDFVVVPGLLELNYQPGPDDGRVVNLQDLRRREVVTLGNDWEYTARLWNKFFRWPERVIRQADQYPDLSQALGVHYRGTDKNTSLVETNCVSPEDFLALIRDFVATHPEVGLIYVATDEKGFVARVQAEHPLLRVINSGEATHHKAAGNALDFSKGDHALLDCWLLSRCKYLLKCQSALSGFAKILNPRLEAYRVSANKLAPWSWGVPYFPDAWLPQFTSQDPACRDILARLMSGDWTQDQTAAQTFGGRFQYKSRKGYMRKEGQVRRWSRDGLQMRFDFALARWSRRRVG